MAEVTDTKDYPTMAEIVQLARVYSEGVVADEYKQTLPIPALVNGEPSISLFYSPVQRMQSGEKGVVLFPADYRVTVSYPDGQFKSLEFLGPETYPDEIDPDGSIGLHRLSLTMEEFEEQKRLLFDSYDELTGAFFDGVPAIELTTSRDRFMKAFGSIHEPPFLFYYRTQGQEFFDWVRGVSQ